MSKRTIDWEKIGKLYQLGQLSVREIARQEDIQPSSIIRHAAKNGWTQDLTETIRQKTNAKLISNTNATPNATDVADAVDIRVAVIKGNIKLIGRLTGVIERLTAFLEEATPDNTPIQALTSAAVNLSNAAKTVIGLERQAFNIGDEPPRDTDKLSLLLDTLTERGSRLPIKPESEPI